LAIVFKYLRRVLIFEEGNKSRLAFYWGCVISLALVQMARNPIEVKNFLSHLRKATGPSSLFITILASSQEIKYSQVKITNL
jgi:hypothetical protein